MEKTYIIDFQAFKDGRNKFIMKELAIISCSANKIVHCIIKPPYGFSSLFSKRKNQVMWLKKNFHGLDWNDGYITPGAAMALFQETVKDADRLLVKGSERCKFIQNLFPTKVVIDLDDLDCPPAKKIDDLANSPQCFHKNHIPANAPAFKEYACSLKYVYKFKVWCQSIQLKFGKLPKPDFKDEFEFSSDETDEWEWNVWGNTDTENNEYENGYDVPY